MENKTVEQTASAIENIVYRWMLKHSFAQDYSLEMTAELFKEIEPLLQQSSPVSETASAIAKMAEIVEKELSEKAHDVTIAQLMRTEQARNKWKDLCERLLKEMDAAEWQSPIQEEARELLSEPTPLSFPELTSMAEIAEEKKESVPLQDKTTLKGILTTVMAIEENQILGNHKEVRRLLLKCISDLNNVIKSVPLDKVEPLKEDDENWKIKAEGMADTLFLFYKGSDSFAESAKQNWTLDFVQKRSKETLEKYYYDDEWTPEHLKLKNQSSPKVEPLKEDDEKLKEYFKAYVRKDMFSTYDDAEFEFYMRRPSIEADYCHRVDLMREGYKYALQSSPNIKKESNEK